MNPWRAEKALWDFGFYLLLMAMLLLPWIQQSLRIRNDSSRYRYFYQSVWHNVLILLVIFLANGLTWLVLLLWSELFKLVGITFFKTLFFATDWFIYLTLGLVTALAVIDRSIDQPVEVLAADLRRAFSGIVAGNVKEVGIRAIEEFGPYKINGDKEIMRRMDDLLQGFVAQHRMKLPGSAYIPCYEICT